jgi:hypothetical protein
MNEKNSYRQQDGSQKKQLRQKFLRRLRKCHMRLKKRAQKRNVPEADHVGMRIYFRPAILEQAPDILKRSAGSLRIMRSNGARGGDQVFADSVRVGMQDKSRKNIAEDHSTEDQSNAADDENSPCAEWRELVCGMR